jgi:hypothetical protein
MNRFADHRVYYHQIILNRDLLYREGKLPAIVTDTNVSLSLELVECHHIDQASQAVLFSDENLAFISQGRLELVKITS